MSRKILSDLGWMDIDHDMEKWVYVGYELFYSKIYVFRFNMNTRQKESENSAMD